MSRHWSSAPATNREAPLRADVMRGPPRPTAPFNPYVTDIVAASEPGGIGGHLGRKGNQVHTNFTIHLVFRDVFLHQIKIFLYPKANP